MHTLHLTNGDSAAISLSRSGLAGSILPWRDVLHDGPVPSDRDRSAFNRARGTFLSRSGWATAEAIAADLSARDGQLDAVQTGDELVLWFEPDLYDQLQLIQVLARIAAREPALRPRITIVPADCFLGPLEPSSMPPLYDARRDLTDEDVAVSASAWEAFTATTPNALPACISALEARSAARTYADDDAVRLPHLAAAIRRMLEEYPDTKGGLSRTERQICEVLAAGGRTMGATFQAQQRAESWLWLGDMSFAWYVQRLSECAQPLIVQRSGAAVIGPPPMTDAKAYWDRPVELTPFGQEVLRGNADHITANGIDRWYGGVHATSSQYWRWDPHYHRLNAS
ncbi:MAG: DUF1835 domain-containing protein [Gemmatimonadaceae bacterium]|nr:DUF1835 domain-containing protein [Gemmatimonadaceae bacterium]